MKKVLQATGNLVIIEQKVEQTTKSGIVIAKAASEGGSMEYYEGIVLAVGPTVTKFKKGDYVIFGRNVMALTKRHGKEYVLVYEPYINCMEKEVDDSHELTEDQLLIEGAQ